MNKKITIIITLFLAVFGNSLFASKTEKGLFVLDYEVISLPNNKSIDLFGTHYLHSLNDWLYVGFGVYAPVFKGNYGGFMALDLAVHVEKEIYKDISITAGTSLGGGGGGSSVQQSIELSGEGQFSKTYLGLAYKVHDKLSLGVNYSHFIFPDSQIDSSQLNFFMQTPISYTTNAYSDAGKAFQPSFNLPDFGENFITFEMNNIAQINPTGNTKDTIHSIYLQLSHFLNKNHYLYTGFDVGYKGIPLYNHFFHGYGYRASPSSSFNFYAQLGVGSGGFSPDKIDTGAGLLLYPKVSLEYLLNKDYGIALSGGYLLAPKGTSKNYTIGAALNFHFSNEDDSSSKYTDKRTFKGYRFNTFAQTEFNVKIGDKQHHEVQLLTIQVDNLINKHLYIASQVSIAYNDFLGYPGYGELLFGFGLQDAYLKSNNFQNFFQVVMGANIDGIIVKPTIGTTYSINDNYALYGQAGVTNSIDGVNLYKEERSFSAYNLALGVSYRFSL